MCVSCFVYSLEEICDLYLESPILWTRPLNCILCRLLSGRDHICALYLVLSILWESPMSCIFYNVRRRVFPIRQSTESRHIYMYLILNCYTLERSPICDNDTMFQYTLLFPSPTQSSLGNIVSPYKHKSICA